MTLNQVLHVVYSFLSNFSSRSRLIRHLEEQQNESQTQDEWMDLAERIDNIQGNDVWRSDPHCQLYERASFAISEKGKASMDASTTGQGCRNGCSSRQ